MEEDELQSQIVPHLGPSGFSMIYLRPPTFIFLHLSIQHWKRLAWEISLRLGDDFQIPPRLAPSFCPWQMRYEQAYSLWEINRRITVKTFLIFCSGWRRVPSYYHHHLLALGTGFTDNFSMDLGVVVVVLVFLSHLPLSLSCVAQFLKAGPWPKGLETPDLDYEHTL